MPEKTEIKPLDPPRDRVEFTERITILLREMIMAGDRPIIDYVLRSTEEQQRLFKEGKSKCDGINKKSKHQSAMAMDIYFVKQDGSIDWNNKELAEKWHKYWEQLGGKPMISWDIGHYE